MTFFLHNMTGKQAFTVLSNSAKTLIPTALTLATAVPLVRIFINSNVNGAKLGSMPKELAANYGWIIWSSVAHGRFFCWALGAFISGSATFSNMMFTDLQQTTAQNLGIAENIVLALQVLGSNAGNMICVVNVVAACSVVSLSGKEGAVIRLTLMPMVIYCSLVGSVATVWLKFYNITRFYGTNELEN